MPNRRERTLKNAERPSSQLLALFCSVREVFVLEAGRDEAGRAVVMSDLPFARSLKPRRIVNNPRWEFREAPRSPGRSTPLSGGVLTLSGERGCDYC